MCVHFKDLSTHSKNLRNFYYRTRARTHTHTHTHTHTAQQLNSELQGEKNCVSLLILISPEQ